MSLIGLIGYNVYKKQFLQYIKEMEKRKKAIPAVYLLFAWKHNSQAGSILRNGKHWTRYYLSLRRVRRPDESIETNDYATRQGRNIALNLILENPKYKGKVSVLRNTNPKQWLKERKRK